MTLGQSIQDSDRPDPMTTSTTGKELSMIGSRIWAIGDGWIPPTSTGPAPDMTSHDSVCMLNASQDPADVDITVYFHDRDPAGPYRISIPAQRVHHQRFNDLTDPETLPHGVDY
jgi:hypothetical protein